MKIYPSIVGVNDSPIGLPGIAFYKYDGSNFRAEWNFKKGFNKFGARRRLIDESDKLMGKSIPYFLQNHAEELHEELKGLRVQKATVYMEWWGEHSFAGSHRLDEPHQLTLFDVHLHPKGILGPRQFLKLFGCVKNCAEIIYEGNLNKSFIDSVRQNKLEHRLNEGIVFKGGDKHGLWMTKIKTHDYLTKLKTFKPEDWQNYWE